MPKRRPLPREEHVIYPLDHIDLINLALADLGWTQKYLADLIWMDQGQLSALLNRSGKGLTQDVTLERIGEALEAAGLALGADDLKRARDTRDLPVALPFRIDPRWLRMLNEIEVLFDPTEQDMLFDFLQAAIGTMARMKLRNSQAQLLKLRKENEAFYQEDSGDVGAVEAEDRNS